MEDPQLVFSWIDYTVFIVVVFFSAAIGIYFGVFAKRKLTTGEYLLGGQTMNYLPVAFSLISSHISGVTVLAVPVDVYKFGSNYIWLCLTIILVCILTYYVYLPVFFELRLTSMYEYLSIRFDRKIRMLASFLCILFAAFHNPIALYLPVIAFTQVTTFNTHLVLYVVGLVCVLYTAIGGIKAVIWSDALQFFGIVVSSLVVLCFGIKSSGGFETLWKANNETGRFDIFDFSIDPTIRDGFWQLVIGGTVQWLSILCLSQQSMQKYLSVPTIVCATKVIIFECIGVVALKAMSVFLGNAMYARFADCDPLQTNHVQRDDQLVPYFVLQTARHISGLPGLFTAGILSACLSSFSSSLNSVACIIYEDFLLPFLPKDMTDQRASNILKSIVVMFGILCILLVYLIENVNGIFPLSNVLQAVTCGPIMGLFTLGMLFPSANAEGALAGGIAGLAFACWVVIGTNWYRMSGLLRDPKKPMSLSGCQFNSTAIVTPSPTSDQIFYLYRISMWYNSLMSAIIVIVFGLLISWLTGRKNKPIRTELLSPLVRSLIKGEKKTELDEERKLQDGH
uniref:Sodium-coupled monocarboxylate transporter 1 n=3 Tax=Photinus pyralis TaxID=7054 RepID=A0A1Y1N1E1_PHOPY